MKETLITRLYPRIGRTFGWSKAVCVVGLFAFFTWLAVRLWLPVPLNVSRSQLRRQYLAELMASNQVALTTYGWIDTRRGIVRLPLEHAIEMTITLWENPAAARSNLLERLSKATMKLPPKPNIYE